MNPLVDLTGGGEFPIVGASFHPPGSFARHDAVVWGYASSATRRGRARPRADAGHGDRRRRRRAPRRHDRRAGRSRRGSSSARPPAGPRSCRRDGRPPPPDRDDGAPGVRDRAVPPRARRPAQLDGPLRLRVADRARRAARRRRGAPLPDVLDPLDVRVPRRGRQTHDPDLPGDRERARDAPVDGPVRHDARLIADPRRDRGRALLSDVRDGHVGLQGLADLRQADGRTDRHRRHARADPRRSPRTGSRPTGWCPTRTAPARTRASFEAAPRARRGASEQARRSPRAPRLGPRRRSPAASATP